METTAEDPLRASGSFVADSNFTVLSVTLLDTLSGCISLELILKAP